MEHHLAQRRRKVIYRNIPLFHSVYCFTGVCVLLPLLLLACVDTKKAPAKGNVILTVDWSGKGAGVDTPQGYEAVFIPSSGSIQKFSNLGGTRNKLAIEPGQGQLIVYALPTGLTVEGTRAQTTLADNLIPASTGWLFCWAEQLEVESESETERTAGMRQQMRELNISISIEPAESLSKINKISATLGGVASEIDIITGAVSSAASASVGFSVNHYLATGKTHLLGLLEGTPAMLTVTVGLDGGGIASDDYDISSLLTDFNASKTTPLYIRADMRIDEVGGEITTDRWQHGEHTLVFSASPLLLEFEYIDGSAGEISVVSPDNSWSYEVTQTGSWCKAEKAENRLQVTVTPNPGAERVATVEIKSGTDSETVTISQEAADIAVYYRDGETVKLQGATAFGSNNAGASIVVMGDGYILTDMNRLDGGKYLADMRTAAEHFFSVYPLSEFREYFNVYMVAAISNEEGISTTNPLSKKDTRFGSLWVGPTMGTGVECDYELVRKYISYATGLQDVPTGDLTAILTINADIYAGTCAMYLNGFSISMCPVGSEFRGIVMHEAGGHGFAKLGDEYIYYKNSTITEKAKSDIRERKASGFYANIDLANDITLTSWSDFNIPKYTGDCPQENSVGTFEGADSYGLGVWRPESNSCMNDNIPYFNAPSRWAIVERISRLCGLGITIQDYMAAEVIPAYPAAQAGVRAGGAFVPLGHPVLIYE